MFYTDPPNRRLTPKEMEDEIEMCRLFNRVPRTFIKDPPFYPYFPPAPKANQMHKWNVNFDLGFNKQGLH